MKENRPLGRMWNLYKMGGIAPAITSVFHPQNAQQMAFIRSVMKEQQGMSVLESPLAELDAVVFDLETTGFSPYNGDEIISFGAVAVKGPKPLEETTFYSVVNPMRHVPVHIERLTGISSAMAQQAPGLLQVLRQFMQFVQKRVLIVHGSGHDKHFLNHALWKTSKIQLSHRMLDTMMIAKWLHPEMRHFDLDSLLIQYGIEPVNRHHALEDALMTARLWSKMAERIIDRNVLTLGDLYAYLSRH